MMHRVPQIYVPAELARLLTCSIRSAARDKRGPALRAAAIALTRGAPNAGCTLSMHPRQLTRAPKIIIYARKERALHKQQQLSRSLGSKGRKLDAKRAYEPWNPVDAGRYKILVWCESEVRARCNTSLQYGCLSRTRSLGWTPRNLTRST
jgi:hypothetical protein